MSTDRLSTTAESFYDTLEPLPEQPRDGLSDAVGAILDHVFSQTKCIHVENEEKLRTKMESAFRRFVALIHVVRPIAISPDGVSGRRLAEALGITPAGFSRLVVDCSDFLGGLRNPAQKSREARIKYSIAGGSGAGSRMRKRQPSRVGDAQHKDSGLAMQDQRTIAEALGKLAVDERMNIQHRIAQRAIGDRMEPDLRVTWTKKERAVLRAHGLIQPGSDELSDAGRERVRQLVGDAQPLHRGGGSKESLGNHS